MANALVTLITHFSPLKNAVGKKNMLNFAKQISWLPKSEQKDVVGFIKCLKESGYNVNKIKHSSPNTLDIFSQGNHAEMTNMIDFAKNEMTQVQKSSRMLMLPSWFQPPYEKITKKVVSSIKTGEVKLRRTVIEASREKGGNVVRTTTTLENPSSKNVYQQIITENGTKEYYKKINDEWKKLFA